MIELTEKQALEIKGGFKLKLFFSATAAITFLIGLVDGYFRPLRCNN